MLLTTQKIIKEWTDYNNHMNLSYYILVFDIGAEVILSKFKMGEHSAKTTKKSTMVVETHTTYNQEVKEGDEVDVFISYFDHDNKRSQYKLIDLLASSFPGIGKSIPTGSEFVSRIAIIGIPNLIDSLIAKDS